MSTFGPKHFLEKAAEAELGVGADGIHFPKRKGVKVVQKKPRKKVEKCDELGREITTNFVFKARRYMLTYKSHIPKKELIQFLIDIVGNEPDFACAAHESADGNHPYEHTHLVIAWDVPINKQGQALFDWPAPEGFTDRNGRPKDYIHPNIKCIVNDLHYKRAKHYLAKEDPENEDLKDPEIWQDRLAECKTEREVVWECQKPQEVLGKLMAWKFIQASPERIPLNRKDMSFWQRQANEIMKTCSNDASYSVKVDWDELEGMSYEERQAALAGAWGDILRMKAYIKRSFHWVVGDSVGKTEFCKMLLDSDPESFYVVQGAPMYRDFATIIEGALKSGWNGDTLLFNLTMKSEDHKSIYDIAEAAKDGLLTSTKYTGRLSRLECKNVWIFANFYPKTSSVVRNRWQIYHVRNMVDDLNKISTDEADRRRRLVVKKRLRSWDEL